VLTYVREEKRRDIPGQMVRKMVKILCRRTIYGKWRSFRETLNEGKTINFGYLELSRLFSWGKVLEELALITFRMLSKWRCRSEHLVDSRDLWQEQGRDLSPRVQDGAQVSLNYCCLTRPTSRLS
jgi:hypothetical protein